MSKKPGKFAAVYKKTSKDFKRSHLTFDNQNHKEGWTQKEAAHLASNPPSPGQRVSYSHGVKPSAGKDTAIDGTAHITQRGKVVKK